MKMKKVKVCFTGLLLTAALFLSGCGSSADGGSGKGGTGESQKSDQKVGLVVSNLGTQSFSDDVNTGIENAQKELGITPMVLEIANITEVENSYETLISQGCNLIVVPVEEYKDAMVKVAESNPDVTFIFTQYAMEGYDNIISMEYRDNEAAFLGGALAASMTKTDQVGVVLAMSTESQVNYLSGFSAGARAINPDIQIQSAYTNSFSDVNLGLETAGIMYERGCDIVASYAGACNLGVFSAAEKAGDGNYCLGAATGQFDKSPEKIIASVVKPIDVSIVSVISDYIDGKLQGGTTLTLGLKEEGVGLKWTTYDDLLSVIPDDVKGVIDDLKAQVSDGTITVPSTEEEVEAFDYSYTKK